MIGGVGEFVAEVDLLVPAFFKIEIGPVFLRFWFRLLVIVAGDGEGHGEGEREGEREEEREGEIEGGRDGKNSSWVSKTTPGRLTLFGVFVLLCLLEVSSDS